MLNINIVFQTKITPQNTFILGFFVYVSFLRGDQKDENTANVALNWTNYKGASELTIILDKRFK